MSFSTVLCAFCNSSLTLSSIVKSNLWPTPCTACTESFISYPVIPISLCTICSNIVIRCCYFQIYGIYSLYNLYLVIQVSFCYLWLFVRSIISYTTCFLLIIFHFIIHGWLFHFFIWFLGLSLLVFLRCLIRVFVMIETSWIEMVCFI